MSISTGNLRRKINIIPDQRSARGDVYYGSATYIVGVYSMMRILPVTHYAGNTVLGRFRAICVKVRKVTDDEGCVEEAGILDGDSETDEIRRLN